MRGIIEGVAAAGLTVAYGLALNYLFDVVGERIESWRRR